MGFAPLTKLEPHARHAVTFVRVSRKWEYRGGTDDGPIQHVDLVLIDTQGNAMYGEIPGTEVESKSHLIQEGGVYIISRFRVSNAKHSFRPVDGRYMVEFTSHTQVSAPRDSVPAFPSLTYRLTPINDLKSRAGDTRDFVDVIGILTEVSEPHSVRLPNKPRPTLTRHIVLRDHSYAEIKVSLWGERASAFVIDQAIAADEGKPIIVLLVGCLMKKYQENYYLSANTAARWYFNPQIPEARHFSSSFQDHPIEVRRVAAPVELDQQNNLPADLELKTLAELNGMDPYDYQDNGYRCTVTIARLLPNVSWWFASCTRCNKSCAPDGAGYRCNACSSDSFRFKYKICFIALDGTNEAEMICFGDVACYIVGKPVQQVLRAATSANPIPADITKIVSRRFTFVVSLTKQSYYRQEKTFQVTSVVAAHGQNDLPPVVSYAGGSSSSGHSTPSPPLTPSGNQKQKQVATDSASTLSEIAPSSVAAATPPPMVESEATPMSKVQESDRSDSKRPPARKRIFGDDYTEENTLAIDASIDINKIGDSPTKEIPKDGAANTKNGGNKRSRELRVPAS